MKTDRELRERMSEIFEDFEAEPLAESWKNIQIGITAPKKRGWGLLFLYGIFCIMGLVGYGAYLYFPLKKSVKDDEKKVIIESTIASKTQTVVTPLLSQAVPTSPENTSIPVIRAKKKEVLIPQKEQEVKREDMRVSKEIAQKSIYQQVEKDSIVVQSFSNKKDIAIEPIKATSSIVPYTMKDKPILMESFPLIVAKKSSKKGYFTVNVSPFTSYQWMEEQANDFYSVGEVSLLSKFDARRLGVSATVAYQFQVSPKHELSFGITGISFPRSITYQRQNDRVFTVENLPNGRYLIEKKVDNYHYYERSLFVGTEIGYRYNFHLGRKPITSLTSGSMGMELPHFKMNYWLNTGFEIPISRTLRISPIFRYQLNRHLDENHLMKTRLYTIGIGLTYHLK